jgi:hypothetical protein
VGVESYADFRRTRFPAIEANGDLPKSTVKFPLRFRYPETEMSNNNINYSAAVAKLDKGDTEYSKMWLLQ